jgi:hypothetical protein
VTWRHLYDMTDEQGELRDRLSMCADEMVTGDGYRLFWFQSTPKVELDAAMRNQRLQLASAALAELQQARERHDELVPLANLDDCHSEIIPRDKSGHAPWGTILERSSSILLPACDVPMSIAPVVRLHCVRRLATAYHPLPLAVARPFAAY